MGDIMGPGATPCRHAPPPAGEQLRHRPVSAPSRRRDPLPGSSFSAVTAKSTWQQQQRWQGQGQRRRRRPETAVGNGRGRGGAGCCGRDRGGSGGRGGAEGHRSFECLQARLAKTVEGSSNFVDDVRRLRKAGGLHHDENSDPAAWGRTPPTRAAQKNAKPGAEGDGAAAAAAAAAAAGRRGPLRGAGDGPASGIAGKGSGAPPLSAAAFFAPAPVCSAGAVEPLALAKELGVRTIVDRITRAIVHGDGGAAAEEHGGGIGGRLPPAERRGGVGRGRGRGALNPSPYVTVANAESFGLHGGGPARPLSSPSPPPIANHRQQERLTVSAQQQAWGSGTPPSFASPPPRPGGTVGGHKTRRPREDIERLRRVVRDTMSSPQVMAPSSSSSFSAPLCGGTASAWGERGGTHHPPQWSQKHEACLAEMRRRLRESGSPLLRAKDPAVLLGALLRRQGPLIRLLDEAVLSLEDTAEALDALVSVSNRLKIAGVSADALFTRAGVVKPGGAGSLGPAARGTGAETGVGTGDSGGKKRPGGEASKVGVRRCTVKRIHVEIHRVLGEVASFREFKVALAACIRGGGGGGGGGRGGGGGGGGGSNGGPGVNWITVDQLDHALRTCHLKRRALDPQGASHPPLTGKRVARFLEEVERSPGKVKPSVATATTAAGTSPNAVNMLLLGNERSQSPTGGASKRGVPAKQSRQGRRAKMARKRRAGKWNDEDRDLAERELAAVVVERQRKFVEGYVRERRRYLSRRVSAQREGHGGFQREKASAGPGGRPSKKVTEIEKAEFSEAVARTKIVLKLLETKATAAAAAASSLPQPNGGGGGNTSGAFPRSASSNGNPGSEVKRSSVGAPNGGSVDTRRDRRRPASAAAAVATTTTATAASTTNTFAPKKKQDGTTSKRAAVAAAAADKGARRNMKQVLRSSTEAYSDRVGRHGGGAARLCPPSSYSRAGGGAAAAGGGISTGGGGERGRMFAAARTVQVAFRQRMFHRFVWAQAYLRSPTHAHGLYKRCLTVLRGADTAAAAPSGGAAPEGVPVMRRAEAPTDASSSIDAWSELPGFCLSLPHHVHAVDPVFLRYVRWRRREGSVGAAAFDDGARRSALAATPAAASAATIGSPRLVASAQEPAQPQQQEPQPEGAQVFEKKHPVRAAAVRSMLMDLRVPFLPGALDSAVEDLERTVAREGAGANVGASAGAIVSRQSRRGGDGRSERDATAVAATISTPPPQESGSGRTAGGGLGQQGAGISFAGWYGWWIRHLPFDPASTGCLLKTVRCAKALHRAEILEAAGKV